LNDQLLLLKKLQVIDAKSREARLAATSLPQKLRPAKDDLARLQKMLDAERARLAETDTWRKEQEELIRSEDEAAKAAKAKLQQSKNARDFSAANREIDNKRRSVAEREQEVLKVMEAMEQTQKGLEAHEADVGALREQIEAEEAKINEQIQILEAEAVKESHGREEIIAGLPDSVVKRYETVSRSKGYAVVPVIDGTCQGCHMSLPPQLANIIARLESIESCSQCQRLLYRPDLMEGFSDDD